MATRDNGRKASRTTRLARLASVVTRDEVPDPQKLSIRLDVNGRRYHGSIATMVYAVPFLIAYLSQFMTLQPGDAVATGTPSGVGMGQKPPVFLRAGDRISLAIEGLGEQHPLVTALHQARTPGSEI